MLLVDVFHHGHLELPRKADDRRQGEQREGDPLQIAAAGVDDEELGNGLLSGRPAEQLGKAVVDPEGDEDADRQEGHQLPQGFAADGGDHALMEYGRAVVEGMSESVRVDLGGRRTITKQKIYRHKLYK